MTVLGANPLRIVCLCEGQTVRAMRKAFSDWVLFHNYTSENTHNSFSTAFNHQSTTRKTRLADARLRCSSTTFVPQVSLFPEREREREREREKCQTLHFTVSHWRKILSESILERRLTVWKGWHRQLEPQRFAEHSESPRLFPRNWPQDTFLSEMSRGESLIINTGKTRFSWAIIRHSEREVE